MHSLNVRLPDSIYDGASRIAREEGRSLNSVIAEALSKVVREREQRELYDAFTLLGQDREEADVEAFLPAQSEVVLHD